QDVWEGQSDVAISYYNHPDARANVYSYEMEDKLHSGAIIGRVQLAKLGKDLFYLSDNEHRRIVDVLKDQLVKWEEEDPCGESGTGGWEACKTKTKQEE